MNYELGLFTREEKCPVLEESLILRNRNFWIFVSQPQKRMTFLSLEPFIPSGKDFEQSKKLFLELGFKINWDGGDYIGFQRDNCQFILQRFDDKHFAENLMMSVRVSDVEEFWKDVNAKELVKKFGVRINPPQTQPYGLEVNMIDLAGVCWHFVS